MAETRTAVRMARLWPSGGGAANRARASPAASHSHLDILVLVSQAHGGGSRTGPDVRARAGNA
jgi:ribosomal protein L4